MKGLKIMSGLKGFADDSMLNLLLNKGFSVF